MCSVKLMTFSGQFTGEGGMSYPYQSYTSLECYSRYLSLLGDFVVMVRVG